MVIVTTSVLYYDPYSLFHIDVSYVVARVIRVITMIVKEFFLILLLKHIIHFLTDLAINPHDVSC